jgi:demethylmenaquinone methyltransferase/2-methoxy-6-polyprenyl-1,4-benzoquinol methylase
MSIWAACSASSSRAASRESWRAEIARPDSAVSRSVLKLYLRGIAPLLSRLVGRTPEAPTLYRYFWDTIEACVPPPRVLAALDEAGFAKVKRHVEARLFSEYTARR